jgi:hypothetical protein
MSFMQQQIIWDKWYEVETAHGTWFLPQDVIGKLSLNWRNWKRNVAKVLPYLEIWRADQVYSIARTKGYGARLSAPGYLDCTEWSVFPTEEEAQEYLDDVYGSDDESEE